MWTKALMWTNALIVAVVVVKNVRIGLGVVGVASVQKIPCMWRIELDLL